MLTLILGILFLLELASLVAFSYWGYQLHVGFVLKIVLCILIPVLVAIIWGLFLAPKASIPFIPYSTRMIFKLGVFLLASAALYAAGRSSLALLLVMTSLVDVALVYAFNCIRSNKKASICRSIQTLFSFFSQSIH